MTIWIDADSCPLLVRNHCVKMGAKYSIPVKFVANKNIPCSENFPFEMIITDSLKDAADNFIYENAGKNDLVVTRDIVFADRLVDKNICTINDRGTVFNKENIKELHSNRDFDLQLAEIGLVKHHHEGYDKKKFGLFANCFDKVIHQLLSKK